MKSECDPKLGAYEALAHVVAVSISQTPRLTAQKDLETLTAAKAALGNTASRRRELEPTDDFDADPNVSSDAFVLERLIAIATTGLGRLG